ncbi:Rieske (2Fe-2S) protein [Methylorubrum extorquens]|uniref:Rieske (2Fe-2S) domain protein n=1 Tax=Methylorubrum extorquens (strain CM4 / NCIMB 13688) TaxID=440085 RepID=B7KWV4_METC4|nr:Rieske (2Fe-2S) protein [Methylorubrum extorquens]ACK82921.1 Rieske (2Fe-2S) domain protein [Methylorubrum extorquens CM4]
MDEPDGWYALALGADIEPSTSAGTRLFGYELVVWRDAAGAVHVWEDRCPHRGMRLSFGFVRGDHIACLYHGWRYDAAGQCRYIPAHPDLEVSPMIRTRTYPCRERAGLIWVRWGRPADAPETAPDEADAVPVAPLRSLYLDAPAARLAAALGGAESDGLARIDLGGSPVLVAVQPLAAEASAAHIVVPAAPDAPTADLARLAAACVALRRTIEGAAP